MKTAFLNLLKGSPAAIALLAVFYWGSGHMERLEVRHATAMEKLADQFHSRNLIAERAIAEILGELRRLAVTTEKLVDRLPSRP